VQRFVKLVAVPISLGITFMLKDMESIRYVSVLTLGFMGIWFYAAR